MSDYQIPELLREAADIFEKELDGHLQFFERILDEATRAVSPDEVLRSHAHSLAQRFHLLKGGAGFLGLEPMRIAATEGDELFKGAAPADHHYPNAVLEWFGVIVKTMRDQQAALEKALRS